MLVYFYMIFFFNKAVFMNLVLSLKKILISLNIIFYVLKITLI